MDMAIRSASSADTAHLERLWQACGLVRPWNDPAADIDLALQSPASTILVGEVHGAIVASALAGFDGHRGWLYYVAVRPDLQGNGLSRQIVQVAEAWLLEQGCPKVELIVREGNEPVIKVYKALGYHQEPRALLAKWLKEPPVPSPDSKGPRLLDVTISYLEMDQPPTRPPARPPTTTAPLALQRVHKPTVHFYRYLQHSVGDPWLWWERRTYSDDYLASIVQDEKVELYVLSLGGEPAGFAELDFRKMPEEAALAYFGLFPAFIGMGLGPYLLNWSVDCAWNRDPKPAKLTVNTCTLDHRSALGGYQKAGFEIVGRESEQMEDPVAAGHIPKSVKILSPGY